LFALAGVLERRDAVSICQVDVGAAVDQETLDRLMTWPAIAEQDRLEQSRPAQAVDVIRIDF